MQQNLRLIARLLVARHECTYVRHCKENAPIYMYYVAPETPMMSSVIADCPDLAPPIFWTSLRLCTLVHSFVTSRLDYCSSLYFDLPATRLNCLDRVLRSAAHLIGRVSKFDHISAYMRDVLHWLPLRQRIEFRVAVLVWYSLIGQAPAYLTDLCRPSL